MKNTGKMSAYKMFGKGKPLLLIAGAGWHGPIYQYPDKFNRVVRVLYVILESVMWYVGGRI